MYTCKKLHKDAKCRKIDHPPVLLNIYFNNWKWLWNGSEIIFLCVLLLFLDLYYTRKIRYSTLPGRLGIVIIYFLVVLRFSWDHKEFLEVIGTNVIFRNDHSKLRVISKTELSSKLENLFVWSSSVILPVQKLFAANRIDIFKASCFDFLVIVPGED